MSNQQGRPIEIVSIDTNHNLNVDLGDLDDQLRSTDKQIVVLSVFGEFRKGKSFLLNYLLRYLQKEDNDKEDWLGDPIESLTGFTWRGGADRDTTGIVAWNQLFHLDDNTVLLLLDTQGFYDGETGTKDEAAVFALSTLLSSVQLFNISGHIKETDLQYLQMFVDYARESAESGETSFQVKSLKFTNTFILCRYPSHTSHADL